MGNQLAAHRSGNRQIDELQNACMEETLGGGRLLKTILYKHDVGKLVVKVYDKQGESLDLKPYKQQLKNIHERLKTLPRPHVWPFQEFVETENTGFMIRPYIFQSLYDRICARPFLKHIEKCWMAYQLLEALEQCHSNGVCHGDIKSENALVTSWSWVFLTDFASYKPTYLPADNPADFSYFFDIAGERRCHVAPERFLTESELKAKNRQAALTPAMDIFSLGCVIAELFLEGKALFDFSELHRYRKGQFNPESKLAQVDAEVRRLILHMIQLDPASRSTSWEYLTSFRPSIFPIYFSKTLGPFFGSLLFEETDVRVAMLKNQYNTLKDKIQNPTSTQTFDFEREQPTPLILKKLSSVRSTRDPAVFSPENTSGSPFITPHPDGADLLASIKDLEMSISKAKQSFAEIDKVTSLIDSQPRPARMTSLSDWKQHNEENEREEKPSTSAENALDGEDQNNGMLLLSVLLCSALRCPKFLETKRTAMRLLSDMAESCSAESCLNRLLPYLLEMLSDSNGSIRALALHFLLKILKSLHGRSVTNYERRLYQDYIVPSLSLLPTDPEEIVRAEYAAGVSILTASACDYLKNETAAKMGSGSAAQKKYENDLGLLRERINKVITEMISGEKSSPKTRSALALSVPQLSKLYGGKKIPDLLPLLTTFLNDTNQELRVSFFECVQNIDAKHLNRSFKVLEPLLEQGLSDQSETVSAAAVTLARHVCMHLGTKKDVILSLSRMVIPLLTRRSAALRCRVIEFLVTVAHVLTPADAYARLLPMLKGILPQDPYTLDSEEIVSDAIHASQAAEKILLPSRNSSSTHRKHSARGGVSDRGKDDEPTVLKISTYSTRVDSRMIHCGLSRHEAILEDVSKSDTYIKLTAPSRERDVHSRSALLTRELCRFSVKHGNLDSRNTSSFAADTNQGQYRSAMADAISTGIDTRSHSQTMEAWKPEGVLLAHYVEHRRCVNQIAVSRDLGNPFFVTASNDGTVKIWDLKRTDDDLSFRSCATYAAQKGEILSISCCDDQQTIASASSHGTVHVWRVNYAAQALNSNTSHEFTGISSRREVSPEEGAILHVQQWDALLLYTSQRGILHAWDIRMKKDAWTICVNPREGLIRHLATDPLNGGTWILTGSSHGVLSLWDVRFKLKVAKWKHPSRSAIAELAPTRATSEQIRSMGIKSQGPFVYIAAGGNEVGLWDIHDQSCKQVFRAIPRDETEIKKMELPSALSPPAATRHDASSSDAAAAAQYCTQQLNRPPTIQEGICTVLPIGEGSLVTGGHDKYIRVWDGTDPKHSFPMCGPMPQNPYSDAQGTYNGYDFQYSRHFERGIPIIDECCLPSHYRQPMRDIASTSQNSSHADCITDLAMGHVHERLLISASRDGVVKIWK